MKQPEQRTAAWFEQRKLRITGSRIGAILGHSPWQKPADVMRAMVREYHGYPSEFIANPAVDHGNNNEQRALLAFMRESGLHVTECGFFEYGDRMGASPDGLTDDDGVLELKVPFGFRNDVEAKFKSLAEQPHYAAQVQMELLATGRNHAYFAQYVAPKGDPLSFDYVPEQMEIERVELDENWIDNALPDINEFYQRLLLELDNPEHLEPLRVELNSPRAAVVISEVQALRERQKDDAAKEKELLAELVDMAEGKNADVLGHKLTLVKRQGAIGYAKAVKELLPDADLEAYRGKPSESWRLS